MVQVQPFDEDQAGSSPPQPLSPAMVQAARQLKRHYKINRLAQEVFNHPTGFRRGVHYGLLGVAAGILLVPLIPKLGVIVLLFSISVILVLMLAEGPYVLFQKVQVRLLELLFMVALLGNTMGLAIARFEFQPNEVLLRIAAYVGIAAGSLLWILRGSVWGLWVATVMKKQGTGERFALMAIGLTQFPGALLPIWMVSWAVKEWSAEWAETGIFLSLMVGAFWWMLLHGFTNKVRKMESLGMAKVIIQDRESARAETA